ncbi:hypothetical protein [Armatimonas sp.]|uniref:hypothetical protein n=1 Tax=Armatimonas sp. TaxID=1872638 RepID=UPI00286D3F0B|nr:hypothetical protein [Armatimonas sp.]
MPLLEVLPTLKQLTRKEKFEAVQYLIADLESDDRSAVVSLSLSEVSGFYEVWSPIDGSESVALAMEELLEEHRTNVRKS